MAVPVNSYPNEILNQAHPISYWRFGDTESYMQAVLADAPTAYWRFEDAPGTLVFFDSAVSGGVNQHPITRPAVGVGTDDQISFGQPGALSNASVGISMTASQPRGVVSGANRDTTTTCTFEFWFKVPSSAAAFQPILCANGGAGVAGVGLYYDGSVKKVDLWYAGAHHYNSTALTVGQLYHVAVQIAAGAFFIFINAASNGGAGGFPGFTIDTAFHEAGGNATLTTSLLDELAYYRGLALDSGRIAAHYAARTSTSIATATPVTCFDSGDGGYDLTRVGAVTLGQPGWTTPDDGAVFIGATGTTGYLNAGAVSAFDVFQRFSVECAIRTTGIFGGGEGVLVSKTNWTTHDGWTLSMDAAGKLRFRVYAGGGLLLSDMTTPLAYKDFNWYHVVATFDGEVAKTAAIYVNGVSVVSQTPNVSSIAVGSASWKFIVGGADSGTGPQQFFSSSFIDEVAFYNYSLFVSEALAHFNARTRAASTVGLSEARADVMRAGAARAGYCIQRGILLVDGVDKSRYLDQGSLRHTDRIGEQPDTVNFSVTGLALNAGQNIVLAIAAPDNRIFSGTATEPTQDSVRGNVILKTSVVCQDGTWTLAERTVTKQYAAGQAAHLVVLDLVANNSTGFTTNNVKLTSPTLSAPLIFKGVSLPLALSQVAAAASAVAGTPWDWYPDPYNDIHFYDVESSSAPRHLTVSNFTYDKLTLTQNITQIRTRMIGDGGGGSATAPVAVGSTTISVDECGWYSASGGIVVPPSADLVAYSGRSASSGPGNLTGIAASGAASIQHAILQGDPINIRVTVDDTAAQTALAALTNRSGLREAYVVDGRLNIAGMTQRLNAELAAWRSVNVAGSVVSRDQAMRSGKILRIQVPARNAAVRIQVQEVTRSRFAQNRWEFEATFATTWKTLIDLLTV